MIYQPGAPPFAHKTSFANVWSGRPRPLPLTPSPHLNLFHHNQPVSAITDDQPTARDIEDLIGAASRVPVSRTATEAATIPFWEAL